MNATARTVTPSLGKSILFYYLMGAQWNNIMPLASLSLDNLVLIMPTTIIENSLMEEETPTTNLEAGVMAGQMGAKTFPILFVRSVTSMAKQQTFSISGLTRTTPLTLNRTYQQPT